MPRGIPTQSRLCELCGYEYMPTSSAQRWCDACRPEARRSYRLAYYHSPNGHARIIAAMRRYRYCPCPGCGKVRWAVRPETLCRRCDRFTRGVTVTATCYWCGQPFDMGAARQAFKKHYCPQCPAPLTEAGRRLRLTKERIRQLVNAEYTELNQNGQHATRAEVLVAIIKRRQQDA